MQIFKASAEYALAFCFGPAIVSPRFRLKITLPFQRAATDNFSFVKVFHLVAATDEKRRQPKLII